MTTGIPAELYTVRKPLIRDDDRVFDSAIFKTELVPYVQSGGKYFNLDDGFVRVDTFLHLEEAIELAKEVFKDAIKYTEKEKREVYDVTQKYPIEHFENISRDPENTPNDSGVLWAMCLNMADSLKTLVTVTRVKVENDKREYVYNLFAKRVEGT